MSTLDETKDKHIVAQHWSYRNIQLGESYSFHDLDTQTGATKQAWGITQMVDTQADFWIQ